MSRLVFRDKEILLSLNGWNGNGNSAGSRQQLRFIWIIWYRYRVKHRIKKQIAKGLIRQLKKGFWVKVKGVKSQYCNFWSFDLDL